MPAGGDRREAHERRIKALALELKREQAGGATGALPAGRGSTLRAPDALREASKESGLSRSWNWTTQAHWSRWSHERVDASHQHFGDAVRVRPPKQPWALKPLRRRPKAKGALPNATAAQQEVSLQSGTLYPLLAAIAPSKMKATHSTVCLVPAQYQQKRHAQASARHSEASEEAQHDAHLVSAAKFTKIYLVNKSLLINSADPMGDGSWILPYPKTYEMLPDMMAENGDWESFKLVMTDLMFLWRKLQGGNQSDLLHLYEKASLALFAQGMHSDRLEAFSEFFFHHLRHLMEEPNMLFSSACASRDTYVKETILDLLGKNENFINQQKENLEQARQRAASDNNHRRRSLSVAL